MRAHSQTTALQQRPSRIMVLVGPRSCGKTRLLMEKAAQHYRVPPQAEAGGSYPPGWLDGRRSQLDSPGSMADELGRSIEAGSFPAALQVRERGGSILLANCASFDRKRRKHACDPSVFESSRLRPGWISLIKHALIQMLPQLLPN